MPRSHGKIQSAIWRDDEWRTLTGDAQRLYMLLLSQPKLTLCGTLDVNVDRWARMASDTTREGVQKALNELAESWFVTIDHSTDELAVRTFAKHDLAATRMNSNLVKGMWRAWEGVESELLRVSFIDGLPADLWDNWLEEHAPDDALNMRETVTNRTARSDVTFIREVGT